MKLFSDRQRETENRIALFESQWCVEQSFPALVKAIQHSGVQGGAAADREAEELLGELALIDLELRLKAGEHARTEQYLAAFPQLSRKSLLTELVKTEFAGRSRSEPDLQWDEFRLRFPQIQGSLGGTTTHVRLDQSIPVAHDNQLGGWTRGSGRFRLLRTHRTGGLGKVWLAHDQELDREIVIKEIKDEYADDTDSRARFAREAVITSALEHPGVVPVYGLGHRHDGRPYYAMRLIRGKSLLQAVEEFHEQEWPTNGDKSIALQRLLNHFLDVCNTIDYAHQQNIIHRDLKPSNIMIGEFGETMVVDWGLAKDMTLAAEPEVSDGSTEIARQAQWSTVAGKAMGSPSYMSPEQASGETDRLGPTTDVYGLGSTLYTLLSNRRPVEGSSSDEVMQRAKKGATVPLTRGEAPRPLIAICNKAMAFRPQDRYASVRELANDVERYLADEPVEAMSESVWSGMARFARRNRALMRVAALALVAIAVVATAAAIAIDQQRVHAERLAESESAAQQRTQGVLDFFVDAFQMPSMSTDAADAVGTVLDKSVAALQDPKNDKDPLVTAGLLTAFSDVYQNLARYDAAITSARLAMDIYEEKGQQGTAPMLKAVETLATAEGYSGRHRQAVALLEKALEMRRELHGIDSDYALEVQAALARAYTTAGRLNTALKQAEAAEAALRDDHGVSVQASVLTALANCYREMGRPHDALAIFQTCMERVHEQYDEKQVLWCSSLNNYAVALLAVGRYEEARDLLAERLPCQEKSFGSQHPDALAVKANLAKALANADELERAIEMMREVLTARRNVLGNRHPSTLNIINDLAWALSRDEKYEEARVLLEEAVAGSRAHYGLEHQATLTHLNNLARSYFASADTDSAIQTMRQVVEGRERVLPPNHPHTLQSKNGLALFYECDGQYEESIRIFGETLKQREAALGAHHPETLLSRHDLAHSYLRAGALDQAIALLNQQLTFLASLPANETRKLRAAGRTVLAEAQMKRNELDQAAATVAAALELFDDPAHHFAAYARVLQAVIWYEQGETDRAMLRLPQAYEDLSDALPTDHPHYAYRLTFAADRMRGLDADQEDPDKSGGVDTNHHRKLAGQH